MGHYAARKILQSSPDKLVLPQWCIVCTVASHRPRWGWGRRQPGWRRATHSTAHASDIISHVTLIFESSRYVDCIRSASVSTSQYSFLPSFLPSISSPPFHPPLFSPLLSAPGFSSSALVKPHAPPSPPPSGLPSSLWNSCNSSCSSLDRP